MAGPGIPYVYNFIRSNNPNDDPILEKENPNENFDVSNRIKLSSQIPRPFPQNWCSKEHL